VELPSCSGYRGLQRLAVDGAKGCVAYDRLPAAVIADYSGLLVARPRGTGGGRGGFTNPKLETRRFPTLAEYSQATGQDRNSITVDYDVFVNVQRLDAKDLKKVQNVYKADDFDFRLKPGSSPIDRGVNLPNITDRFAGKSPDLGALESGEPLPHYGPRR
jgi:hypothetical protein